MTPDEIAEIKASILTDEHFQKSLFKTKQFANGFWDEMVDGLKRKDPSAEFMLNRVSETNLRLHLYRSSGKEPTHTDQRKGYELMGEVQNANDRRVASIVDAKFIEYGIQSKQAKLVFASTSAKRQLMSREDWLAGKGSEVEDEAKKYLGKTVNQCRELVTKRHLLMTKDDNDNPMLKVTTPSQFQSDLTNAFNDGQWIKRADYELFVKPFCVDKPIEASPKIKHINWVRRLP